MINRIQSRRKGHSRLFHTSFAAGNCPSEQASVSNLKRPLTDINDGPLYGPIWSRIGHINGVHVKGTYAFSLDRESFTGIFSSRREAYDAGRAAADRLHSQVTEIYVGQRVAGDPQADLHAWEIIKSMRERARAAAGDQAAGYLKNVTADQAKDLDGALEAVISRWLTNYKIGPSFFRIEAVSEHPLPTVSQVYSNGQDDEVYDLGPAEY
jgi:hypothetical protein